MLSTNGCVVIGVSALLRYFSNWGIACHACFSLGGSGLDLSQTLLRVALAWHNAGSSTPKDPRVNDTLHLGLELCLHACPAALQHQAQSSVARGSQTDHLEHVMFFERKGWIITVFTS